MSDLPQMHHPSPCEEVTLTHMLKHSAPMQTILSVPTMACLIVDYDCGLQVPAEEWPRLQKGLQKEDALPWDVLLVGPVVMVSSQ